MADKLEELFTKIRSGLKLLSPHDVSLISKSMSQSETENLMVEALKDFKNRTREEEEWEGLFWVLEEERWIYPHTAVWVAEIN